MTIGRPEEPAPTESGASSSAAGSTSLLLRTLAGESTTRRPLWLMRQAGRSLPEYRALRERYRFEQLMDEPELAAQVTLQPLRRFQLDAAITFADIMSPLGALGIEVRFDPGPVITAPLRDRASIRALPDPDRLDPDKIAPSVARTQRLVAEQLSPETPLLGFAGAPLTLAAYLVEGRGHRGFPRLRALAHAEPDAFATLLDTLSRLTVHYLLAQVRAGAQAVQLFDSWAGLFSRADWRSWVAPHLSMLLQRYQDSSTGVPLVLFVQQAPHLVDDYAALAARHPPCALSVDWRADLARLRAAHPELVLQGNLDPALLLAGEAATRRAAEQLFAELPRRGERVSHHVVNLGHGLLPRTPLASIQALVDAVHGEASAPLPILPPPADQAPRDARR